MAGPCGADFQRLAAELGGFGCEDQNPFLNLHNPLGLDHWTMLVIELAMLTGAGLTLRHALGRRRRGDPTGLSIWLASIAYLIVVEPPLYFPDAFGLKDQVGLIFVHNQFTVQFLYDRLPLYIICTYPVMAFLAYELVRVIGVIERRGPFVSALAVGFVYHCFYEIFDHVGPQLGWWIWNPTAPTNEPMLASVPISSMVNFAVAGPVALTFLCLVLVGKRPDAGSMPLGKLVFRSVIAGVLMPVGLVLGGLPATVFTFGDSINRTGQAIAYLSMLTVVGIVALSALTDAYRHRAGVDDPGARRYLARHAAVYLAALVVAWAAAMPEYLAATDGITASGSAIGSLPYAGVCFVFSLGFLWLALTRRRAPAPSAVPA